MTENKTSTGFLKVQTFKGDRVFPMPNVTVNIYKKGSNNGKEKIYSTKTNQIGITDLIPLETVPKTLSLSPGNTTPYYVYDVEIMYPGYYTKYYVDLPIFGENVSVQNVQMIPVPEGYQNPETKYIIDEEPDHL